MEIVILMEKEKRTLSYVRIYLSSEPPYTADWRLIKEKLQLVSFALIVLQAQEIKYTSWDPSNHSHSWPKFWVHSCCSQPGPSIIQTKEVNGILLIMSSTEAGGRDDEQLYTFMLLAISDHRVCPQCLWNQKCIHNQVHMHGFFVRENVNINQWKKINTLFRMLLPWFLSSFRCAVGSRGCLVRLLCFWVGNCLWKTGYISGR